MKPRVYIETTVVSYLTGRPSRDMVVAAHQQVTQDWWERRAAEFDLFVSELVQQEASRGDPEAARKRVSLIQTLPLLQTTEAAVLLAERLVAGGAIPKEAGADALHISIAAMNGMDFLLTWNCTHIANAVRRHQVEALVAEVGFDCPVICTPEELMEA